MCKIVGGGSPLPPKKEDPFLQRILCLISTSAVGLFNPYDSDSIIPAVQDETAIPSLETEDFPEPLAAQYKDILLPPTVVIVDDQISETTVQHNNKDFVTKPRLALVIKHLCFGGLLLPVVWSQEEEIVSLEMSGEPKTFHLEESGFVADSPAPEELSTSATITTLANPTPSTSTAAHPTVSRPRHVRQQGIERYGAPKKISGDLKRKIDNDVLDLFIDSYHPFTLVEERAFKKLMRWIPGYQLPTRKTISNVMIPALYNKTEETLKTTTLGSIEHLCLTADLWTSRANESYLAVTCHFITEEFELKTILLDCSNFEDSHTSENIQSVLTDLISKYELTLNKINFIVTDNAANIQRAVTNIGWKHYGCYAHTLNLILQNAITREQTLQSVLDKVKKIVRFFKKNSTALEKLLKAQTNDQPNCVPKRLIQEVPTRWNSSFHMIRRFVELEHCIRSTVAVIRKDLPIITNEEWLLLAEVTKILKPFDDATESMSGEKYMTGSSVIVMTRCLITSCDKLLDEEFCDVSKELIYTLRTGLIIRFSNLERSGTFSVCTFLDPRYKLAVFSDENEIRNTKKRVQDLLSGIIAQERAQEQAPVSASEDHNNADKFSPWTILDAHGDDGNNAETQQTEKNMDDRSQHPLEHETIEKTGSKRKSNVNAKSDDDHSKVLKRALEIMQKEPDENDRFGEYVIMELKSLRFDSNRRRLKSEIRRAIARIADEDDTNDSTSVSIVPSPYPSPQLYHAPCPSPYSVPSPSPSPSSITHPQLAGIFTQDMIHQYNQTSTSNMTFDKQTDFLQL
ncbi:unnamed protein product [Chilo suppressalis]|uniref:DUF659 domain-containing protein n=1 Tax=Chilo suppressalis TaxID=168631 RepID=A0ABN8B4P4_CHISP|nr:unnamed protein product [Chilo suppressalis]